MAVYYFRSFSKPLPATYFYYISSTIGIRKDHYAATHFQARYPFGGHFKANHPEGALQIQPIRIVYGIDELAKAYLTAVTTSTMILKSFFFKISALKLQRCPKIMGEVDLKI